MNKDGLITGYTELVGLIAYPIRHSNSPAMQNEAFREAGIDCIQLAFEVDNSGLEDAIKGLRALGLRGANVSMPNKTVVGQYLDRLSEEAVLTGSVNTIVNEGGVLTGYCTDGIGYTASLRDNDIDIRGQKLTVVGAGGAATAMQIQVALEGAAEISVFNVCDRFFAAGEETVEKINRHTSCRATLYDLADVQALRREIADSFLLANATGLGMKPHEGKTWLPDVSYLRPDLIVTDTVYAPPMTRLLEMAEEAGCKYMNGHGMMLFQGAAAFKLWTGREMPVEHMKQALGISYPKQKDRQAQ